MTNARIADIFEQVADLLEFQGANPFRTRAYRNGARVIRDLTEPVTAILDDERRSLTDIDGIGKDLARKIEDLARTGALPLLQELLAEIPASVLALLRIPGLGPKRAALLYRELHIATLEQLEEACSAGRIRALKGFGAKTEQAILQGLDIAQAADQRIYWAQADQIAHALRAHLQTCDGVQQLELAGSYRRGRETVGDLDLLAVSSDAAQVMDRLEQFPDAVEVIARGDTKMSTRLRSGLQIDLRVVPARSFGAALQYFTGSKEHNVELRRRAKHKGLKINEYGVFRVAGEEEIYVAGATEEDVYAALDLPTFPPELRENRREFQWAEAGPLPQLVELSDIRGDLHMHTTATDGTASLEEMVEEARRRGLKYIAITDHSQRVSVANGLDPRRLLKQWAEIDKLNETAGKGFLVLKGVECDILERGGLDLPDDVLAAADWVLAALHFGQRQSRSQITDRIVEAIENPYVSAIAHPTGRLINRRQPYDVDLEALLRAAKEHGTLLELNAHPARLDLNDIACAAAKNLGVPIVIGTDAHSPEGLDDMRYGVLQARRGGLTRKDVANTAGWARVQKLLGKRRK